MAFSTLEIVLPQDQKISIQYPEDLRKELVEILLRATAGTLVGISRAEVSDQETILAAFVSTVVMSSEQLLKQIQASRKHSQAPARVVEAYLASLNHTSADNEDNITTEK